VRGFPKWLTRLMRPWLSSSTATVLPACTCLMMNRDDPLPEIHTHTLTESTAHLRISILSQLRPDTDDFFHTLSDADQIVAIKACLLAWEVSQNFDTQICPCPWQIVTILASINNTINVDTEQSQTRHHLHFGTALTQARDRRQDQAQSMLLSSTFALPKKGPGNLPDPLTRDWYNPGNFRFRLSCEGLVTRLGTSMVQQRSLPGCECVFSFVKEQMEDRQNQLSVDKASKETRVCSLQLPLCKIPNVLWLKICTDICAKHMKSGKLQEHKS
jgi:hypothetical protein